MKKDDLKDVVTKGFLKKELDKRFGNFELKIDKKFDKRFSNFELKIDKKFDERFALFNAEIDKKFEANNQSMVRQLGILMEDMMHRLDGINEYIRDIQDTKEDVDKNIKPRLSSLEIRVEKLES